MTAKNNWRDSVYLYAQSLDNSGENPCLSSHLLGECRELESNAPERATLLKIIDSLSNDGKHWHLGTTSLDCKINYRGDCLVTIRPLTLDNGGRLAPVMLIFNIWGWQRQLAPLILENGCKLLRRELSNGQIHDIAKLKNIVGWPSLLIALHTIIFSRRASHD